MRLYSYRRTAAHEFTLNFTVANFILQALWSIFWYFEPIGWISTFPFLSPSWALYVVTNYTNLTKRSFPFYINLRSTCSKNRVWVSIGLHARLQQKAQYVFKCLKTTGKFAKRLTNTRSLIIKIAVKSIERRKKEKDKNCRIPADDQKE